MSVSFAITGNRVVWTNADGDWSVWLGFTENPSSGAVVGPGYLGRLKRPDGSLLVEDYYDDGQPWRAGGLGMFAAHVARDDPDFQTDPVNHAWNVSERNGPGATPQIGVVACRVTDGPRISNGVGGMTVETDLADPVSYGDGSDPKPIFTVSRDYRIYDSRVECYTRVTCTWDGTGEALYVGEPKLFFSSIGPSAGAYRYRWLDLYDKAGGLLEHFDLYSLPDPTVHTHQMGQDGRCRMRLGDGSATSPFFNVVAQGARDSDGVRFPWEGNPYGFDQWAQHANPLAPIAPSGAAYCLQGPLAGGAHTLTRQWEAWRWGTPGQPNDAARRQTTLACHAWEQGTGPYDCFVCYRPVQPGESYYLWHCLSVDAGWVV